MTQYIDLDQLIPGINGEKLLELIVEQHLMTSSEVMERLEISKQRLFSLKKQGLLHEIKKGIFSRKEVETMRTAQLQEERLKKYNKKTAYELTPAYKNIDKQRLIINKLRFFDCLTMVKHEVTNGFYNNHLAGALQAVLNTFEENGFVYLLEHEGFDYVENLSDLQSVVVIKTYTKNDYVQFMESVEAQILGLSKVNGYSDIIAKLKRK